MAKGWTATNNLIRRNGIPMASAYGLETAAFLAAAAEHYVEFLQETAHVPDAEIDPTQLSLFGRKTQKKEA